MKRLVFTAVVLVAILVALTRVEYGFYSPRRGIASAGRDDVNTDARARQLLRVTVTAADLARDRGATTIESLSRFYGTTDSLPCSILEQFKSDDPKMKDRPFKAGDQVTLCLN
jgi:hypothetical protein